MGRLRIRNHDRKDSPRKAAQGLVTTTRDPSSANSVAQQVKRDRALDCAFAMHART